MIRKTIGAIAIVVSLGASVGSATSLGSFHDVTLSAITTDRVSCDTSTATVVNSPDQSAVLGVAGLGSDCTGLLLDVLLVADDVASGGREVQAAILDVLVAAGGNATFPTPIAVDPTRVTTLEFAVHETAGE